MGHTKINNKETSKLSNPKQKLVKRHENETLQEVHKPIFFTIFSQIKRIDNCNLHFIPSYLYKICFIVTLFEENQNAEET